MLTMKLSDQERLYKALANRKRIAILRYLKNNGDHSVSDVADHIGISDTATSKHLLALQEASLVQTGTHERPALYRIRKRQSERVKRILKAI